MEVSKEKCIVYHPEYKGVRLDIYAEDAEHTHYNVEMQAIREVAQGKRSRYYHSQLDMELLEKGADYSELPPTYVIFICDFDPFCAQKYCYSFESRCSELPECDLGDFRKTIFLSTKGMNTGEVPEALVKFLQYVSAGLEESTRDFGDDFVRDLQRSVQNVKASREMEGRYMLFEELLHKQYNAGKAEGRAEDILLFLADKGEVPEALQQRITAQTDMEVLKRWLRTAASASSVAEFEKQM